uniref:DUF2961 domain-containing protein n=1 Tax=Anaerolinea thermolimosa TaxID=229919 RepID=A0A7C4PMS8_9CHLR
MQIPFNGLGLHLGNLPELSHAIYRSISAENPRGEKGKGGMSVEGLADGPARELGQGWKVRPCITLGGREVTVLADIQGPGAVQHIWITVDPAAWRRLVLRMYWDHEPTPSVETPLGDFFCNGWGVRCNVNSLPVAVNPAGGFNSYWEMPFREHARITIEILDGKPGPQRDVVLLNAAAALVVAGAAADWHAGLQLAAEAIDSGAALDKLRGLQRFAA